MAVKNILDSDEFLERARDVVGRIIDECWCTAERKGWHALTDTVPTKLLMIHSEISEATECFRDGDITMTISDTGKPEGLVVELVDAVIRIFDSYIMLQQAHPEVPNFVDVLLVKMEYNRGRPTRHGGKAI